ncbi:hypothetical protein CHGG_00595 [Chaetomium globosum CBS 148.51]|uniref:Uncharacterized protein n=1 Tax=Chaetomium globosum (strain ATCC 6205 / CBS 148.51 / DSM 1962 / NBRC 6347 / NRRL 1970) TaxID=306901 RepID=Q2HGQ9_CHAGB|nr:uncharacterized protein CHGG_00595 [Chaetomium globosum CBS 148.51]EAQ92360.1 hypothetical protein CHGG_00595 [Chaetomium globosum CBS 148.51]
MAEMGLEGVVILEMPKGKGSCTVRISRSPLLHETVVVGQSRPRHRRRRKASGRMISEAFVRNGARVYIASRDAAACHAACAELNALPDESSTGTAIPLPADLSSLAECERLAAALAAREPRLHVLVNNSGATWGEAYDSYPDAAWTKLLTLNVQRVFALTSPAHSAAGVSLTARREGRGGPRPPDEPRAGASKAALHHLSPAPGRGAGPARRDEQHAGVRAVPEQDDGGDAAEFWG